MKNLRSVYGKPLVAHAIECGLACPSITHVVVSTDNSDIASTAKAWGADVPFMRPGELAQDTTPMLPVLQHAVEACEVHYGQSLEFLVLLDPTGPQRTANDIETCIQMIRETECDAVVSGNLPHRSPFFNMVVPDGEFVKLAMETNQPVGARQQSPVVHDLNTVVWVYNRRALMEEKARLPKRTRLYLVPRERAIDIDTELDFTILETLMKKNGHYKPEGES